jgi:5-amino-6-(5-phosphoribosylamino)uracil reductase
MQELVEDGETWDLTALELVNRLTADSPELDEGRSWVSTNMVSSLDGAYAVEGTSRGLGSKADQALFLAQRWLADAVLVGAGTARAERYRRPTVDAAAADLRRSRGQAEAPLLVVVSGSGRVPPDQPFLTGDGPAPLIVHPEATDPAGIPPQLERFVCGEERVDVVELLAELARRGLRRIDCEGGPGLLGQLAAVSAIDEYLLTLSPRLVGGGDVGLLGGQDAQESFNLHRVLRDGEHLMLCYRRA